MKNFLKSLIAFSLFFVSVPKLSGQTILTTTTLSAPRDRKQCKFLLPATPEACRS